MKTKTDFGACYDCKTPFESEDEKELVDGVLYVCHKCRISGKYFTCDECGGMFRTDNSYSCDGGCDNSFCRSCWNDRSEGCNNCDEIMCSNDCMNAHYDDHHNDSDSEDYSLPLRKQAKEYANPNGESGKIITSERAFGVEIECYYPDGYTMDKASDALPKELGITEDGSLSDNGVEFVTPKLYGKTGEEFIRKVTLILNAKDFYVNKTCGLHIHLDANGDYWKEKETGAVVKNLTVLWLFYLAFDDCLLALLPSSRRTSTYCLPLGGSYSWRDVQKCYDVATLERAWYKYQNDDATLEKKEIDRRKKDHYDGTRYNGVNMHSLFAEGHLEIRYHSGTLEASKILYWVDLHQRIMDRISSGKITEGAIVKVFSLLTLTDKMKAFWSMVELPEANHKYFVARLKKFNPSLAEEAELSEAKAE